MTQGKNGLPFPVIVFLAMLAVPRVFVHDLKLVPIDSFWYTVLAVGPLLIWLGVAIFVKMKRPAYDFLVLGIVFGILLAVTHQLTWNASWGATLPHIGGTFAGRLSPGMESLVLRSAAVISSLVTGVVFGALFALLAAVVSKLRNRTGGQA